MLNDLDHFEAYYADKLWNLLPAVYRAEDTDQFERNGPLREMVNRIGAQVALVRRNIDRVWEDQSIETCDDWIIPYIGDLLATNIVAGLDARGQRLDVAKTIYYRRRKGTVAVLEEIAANITGWEAKVVEFFRCLARTAHSLDPAIGIAQAKDDDTARMQLAERIVGPLSRTPRGGFADLRNIYGAKKAGSAFDEFFHTADFRYGRGQVGWHNIPRLGVFLWRLKSFGLSPTTPVRVTGCDGWYTFDPTGRDIPLFAQASRLNKDYSNWVSPVEAQLPTPITQELLDANEKLPDTDANPSLYPHSLSVLPMPNPESDADALAPGLVTLRPARGRFKHDDSSPPTSPPQNVWVQYHYGFSSEIGAGPYDRRPGRKPPPMPGKNHKVNGGLDKLVGSVPLSGTLSVEDSLTYDDINNVSVEGQLTILAENKQRPLIRLPKSSSPGPADWILTGKSGTENCLVLDGLFVSSGDVVLTGDFDCVTITCCTFDPGSAPDPALNSPPQFFALAADGRELFPTRLRINGTIRNLIVERSILGPICVVGGAVETLVINDSIIQALPESTTDLPTFVSSPPKSSPPAQSPETALLLRDGEVKLSRCTILGQVFAHRFQASECILHGVAIVDDVQNGCIRFSALANGSVLPRKYESVRILPGAPLFTSTAFGQPGYAQLLPTADFSILPSEPATGIPQNTISSGAEDGSEMGAFAREKNPIKERALLVKYLEFMPAGLVPVIVYVT